MWKKLISFVLLVLPIYRASASDLDANRSDKTHAPFVVSEVANTNNLPSIQQEIKPEARLSDNTLDRAADTNSTETNKPEEEEKNKDKNEQKQSQIQSPYSEDEEKLLKDFLNQYEPKRQEKDKKKKSFSCKSFFENIFISFPKKVWFQSCSFLENPFGYTHWLFYWSMLQVIQNAFSERNRLFWTFFGIYKDKEELINSLKKAKNEGRLLREMLPKALPLLIFSFVGQARGIIGVLGFLKQMGEGT
jgi:hypothetical protein